MVCAPIRLGFAACATPRFSPQTTDWSVLLVSALGASFVGGVLGGTLTTWLRGRIEREEAWRTRLIDAADDFMEKSAQTLLLGGQSIHYFSERSDRGFRTPDGDVTPAGLDWLAKVRTANLEARVAALRIGLLFGPGSRATNVSNSIVQKVRMGLNLLEGVEEAPADETPIDAAEFWIEEARTDVDRFSEAVHERLGVK